jgi:hypothetical protein
MKPGHSLIEMLIALSIAAVAVAAATGGWIHVLRIDYKNSTQIELDLDVRKSIERLKQDLRLSSLNRIYYYPPGPGPYTAVSFPVITNRTGLVTMAPDGSNIQWGATVIYHKWGGTPNKLLRTVFSNRNDRYTDYQFQRQLESVVVRGSGTNWSEWTTNGSDSAVTTVSIFENMLTNNFWCKGTTYDAYAPDLARDERVTLGSVYLTPGPHDFQFRSLGRNPLSSGNKIGIDTLTASPSASAIEAEAKYPPAGRTNGTASASYMSQGSWSGNYQFLYQDCSSNDSFTLRLNNDQWLETNFRGAGSTCTRTKVAWDSSNDFVVQLEGNDYTWHASDQTGGTNLNVFGINNYYDRAYRTLIRGSAMTDGSFINYDGRTAYFLFRASPYGQLRIKYACIAPADNHTNFTINAAEPGTPILFSDDHSGSVADPASFTNSTYSRENVTIGYDCYAWGLCTNIVIDKTKSYLVSFVADCSIFWGSLNSTYAWEETHPGAPGTYALTNVGNATKSDVTNGNWSAKAPIDLGQVIGLSTVYTLYPTNGIFKSQILDTYMAAPAFSNMTWTAELPNPTNLVIQLRTGDDPDLTNSLFSTIASPGAIAPPAKRYVQFQAILSSSPSGWHTPKLKNVTLSWPGEARVVDVSATMTKGPDYGIVELTVDGRPLVKGLRMDLTIYKDIVGWRAIIPPGRTNMQVTSAMSVEVEPRNSGK